MSRAGTLQLTAAAVVLALGANVAIGVALAGERTAPAGALVALLPAILVLAGALVATHRHVLVFAALALNLSGLSIFARPLPLPAGPQVFPADALLLLAVGAALVARLTPRTAADPGVVRPRLRTPVLGLPLLLLVVGLTFGIIKGHERYGSPLIGQPTRLFLFAAIAVAPGAGSPPSSTRAPSCSRSSPSTTWPRGRRRPARCRSRRAASASWR
jgi:hypothetical protein